MSKELEALEVIGFCPIDYDGKKYTRIKDEFGEEFNIIETFLKDRQIAVYNQDTNPNLRTQFEECVKEVFDNVDKFLDLIDNGGIYEKFDVVTGSNRPDDEYYIIDRKTGEYINWYKYTHIGRSIHMNFNPVKMKDFLTRFKESEER